MNTAVYTKERAIIELIGAGAIWGFGFIATKHALTSFSIYELLCYRFFIAFAAGELIHFLFFRKKINNFNYSKELKLTFVAGVLMAGFIIPQTIGLLYTTATKSGFLTSLYIIFVPLFGQWFFKEKIPLKIYLSAFIALIGAAMLMDLQSEAQLNKGDLWTLLCAVVATLHIIYIGHASRKSKNAFRFNNYQSFWCLICLLPFLLTQEKINYNPGELFPWLGVLFMALGSSLIAFTIQIRSQTVLSNTTASMLFLLESPFAFLFGYLILNETLSVIQLIGSVIILVSSYLTVAWEEVPTKHSTEPIAQ